MNVTEAGSGSLFTFLGPPLAHLLAATCPAIGATTCEFALHIYRLTRFTLYLAYRLPFKMPLLASHLLDACSGILRSPAGWIDNVNVGITAVAY